MGKKKRKARETEETPPLDEAIPETEELPHDRFPPLWRNIRWGQILFGVAAALLGVRIARFAEAGELGTFPAGLTLGAAALLLLAFVVYLNSMYRHGLVPDYSRKCRHCNGPVNRYSEFCEHCGGDLIAPEKLVVCGRCGTEVYEGTRHCPECGARIGKGSPKKPRPAAEPEEGWDEPLGAGSPPPWER